MLWKILLIETWYIVGITWFTKTRLRLPSPSHLSTKSFVITQDNFRNIYVVSSFNCITLQLIFFSQWVLIKIQVTIEGNWHSSWFSLCFSRYLFFRVPFMVRFLLWKVTLYLKRNHIRFLAHYPKTSLLLFWSIYLWPS